MYDEICQDDFYFMVKIASYMLCIKKYSLFLG